MSYKRLVVNPSKWGGKIGVRYFDGTKAKQSARRHAQAGADEMGTAFLIYKSPRHEQYMVWQEGTVPPSDDNVETGRIRVTRVESKGQTTVAKRKTKKKATKRPGKKKATKRKATKKKATKKKVTKKKATKKKVTRSGLGTATAISSRKKQSKAAQRKAGKASSAVGAARAASGKKRSRSFPAITPAAAAALGMASSKALKDAAKAEKAAKAAHRKGAAIMSREVQQVIGLSKKLAAAQQSLRDADKALRSCRTKMGQARKKGDLSAAQEKKLQARLEKARREIKAATAAAKKKAAKKTTKKKAKKRTKKKVTKKKATRKKATKKRASSTVRSPRVSAKTAAMRRKRAKSARACKPNPVICEARPTEASLEACRMAAKRWEAERGRTPSQVCGPVGERGRHVHGGAVARQRWDKPGARKRASVAQKAAHARKKGKKKATKKKSKKKATRNPGKVMRDFMRI